MPPTSTALLPARFMRALQLGHERAVIPVLRRHQRNGLPTGREDDEALAVGAFDIGAKPARLHRYRPVRQPDRRDIAVAPDPDLPPTCHDKPSSASSN